MQIYDHDSPEAINFKNSSIELEDWIELLNYSEKEISNLLSLVKSTPKENEELTLRIKNLEHIREVNMNNLAKLMKYRSSLPKAAECEDVECDMFYVNEHISYRKMYRDHIENYRKIKEEFFEAMIE